jgi:CheY-like chemotaxis protein
MTLTSTGNVPGETILVVDDDVIVRMIISEYLRHCGYRVIEAASADEALTVFNHSEIKVDVLLTDVGTPGSMDGFGLAKWVRANRPEVDVALAGTVERAAAAARELCDEGPLSKPYEPQTVVDRIKRLRAARKKK